MVVFLSCLDILPDFLGNILRYAKSESAAFTVQKPTIVRGQTTVVRITSLQDYPIPIPGKWVEV